MESWTAGIDLGGTKTLIIARGESGNILKEIKFKTDPKRGPEAVLNQSAEVIFAMADELKRKPKAVGIGIAGQIEKNNGTLLFGPNLDWKNVPIKDLLEAKVGCKAAVINDVRAATLAEWLYGAGKGVQNLALVFAGTGIGGGFITEGHLLEGACNSAGEIGHMIVELNGPKCPCGNFGCLEALAGGVGIAKNAKNLLESHPEKRGVLFELAKKNIEEVDAKLVIEAYRKNDPLAIEIIHKAKKALVAGLISIVHLMNPGLILFGGGIFDALSDIFLEVEAEVKKMGLKSAVSDLTFKKAALENTAVAIGAAIKAEVRHQKKN